MVTITIRILPITLLRVVHPHGHQLVLGGRLLREERDGIAVAHPDLPPYTQAMCPIPDTVWEDDEAWDSSGYAVEALTPRGHLRRIGVVRAWRKLFTPVDAEAARAWLRGRAK